MAAENLNEAFHFSERQEESSFADVVAAYKKNEALSNESAVRQFLAGTTLGLSSVLSSPFMSEEHKQELLNYKIKNPLKSGLWEGFGAGVGALFTGGLGLAKLGGTAGKIGATYELLQGAREVQGVSNTAKMWAIGGATMAATDMVDTASLDPSFVANNMGHYAGEILQSSIFGGALGAGFKTIGRTYAKYIKGENFLESAPVPSTSKERALLGDKLAEAYSPQLGTEGTLNEMYNSAQKGKTHTDNVNFFNTLHQKMLDDVGLLLTNPKHTPSDESMKSLIFLKNVLDNENVADIMAKSETDAVSIFNNWNRVMELSGQNRTIRPTASGTIDATQGSIIRQAERNASLDFDPTMIQTNITVEQSLKDRATGYFTQEINDVPNSPSLAHLTNPEGFFERQDKRFNNILHPEFDPKQFTPEQIEANRNYIKELNSDVEASKLFRELQKKYETLRTSLAETVKTPSLYEFTKTGKINKTYRMLKDVTPSKVYESLQNFRQSFNRRADEIQKKLKERLVIDNPLMDTIWKDMKGDIYETMAQMYGKFGEDAAKKSDLLNKIGSIQRRMIKRLSSGEIRKLPAPIYAEDRANVINKAWRNIGKVGPDAVTEWQPSQVRGWLKQDQKEMADAFGELQAILPNNEIGALAQRTNDFFERQLKVIDDINATNDTFVKQIFRSSKIFEENRKGLSPKGLKPETRIAFMIKDFFEGGLAGVSQATRGGFAQMARLMMDAGEILGKRFLKFKGAQRETAQQILYQTLSNISELSVQRTRTMNAIRSASSYILGLETLDKAAIAARNQFLSYASRAEFSSEMDEVNDKFDKISKNLDAMRADPSQYIQRINFSVGNLRAVSPEIADASIEKILDQIGLVNQILPRQPEGVYYKKNIPLADKAKFLDNFEALTNPSKMIEKMKYGTITKDQLKITEVSYPDIWEKTLSQIRTDLYLKNPSQEARSRVYSMFGIQDSETLSKAQQNAKEMILAQYEAEHPKAKVSPIRQPRVKSLQSRSNSLTPQGMRN